VEQEYGYLSYHYYVVLGVDEVDRLVHTITEMFGTRGLTIPFLFSNLALDANTSGVRRLIQTFLRTCVSFHALDTERTWHEEARFAIPAVGRRTCHVPSMGSCPSLACVWGHVVRGLLSWDLYVEGSVAKLGKRFSPPRFYIHNVDARP